MHQSQKYQRGKYNAPSNANKIRQPRAILELDRERLNIESLNNIERYVEGSNDVADKQALESSMKDCSPLNEQTEDDSCVNTSSAFEVTTIDIPWRRP